MREMLLEMVGERTFEAAEGTMRTHVQRMMGLDWFNAGRASGVAPDEWDLTEYGRNVMLGHVLDGVDWQEAALLGIKAVYKYAWGDIRDSVYRPSRALGTAHPVWGMQDSLHYDNFDDPIYVEGGYAEIENLDLVHSALEGDQLLAFVANYQGYSRMDAAELLGMSLRTFDRRLAEAREELKGVLDNE